MAGKKDEKWRGRVTEVIVAPIDKVWPIISDFDGLHKFFPQIFATCEIVEGENNKVGSLRKLTAPLPDGSLTIEAHERLISLDHVSHTTTYTIEWINLGWTGYKANFDAKSTEDGQTLVAWTVEVDPVSGQTEEQYLTSQQGLFNTVLNLTKGLVAE